MKAWIPLLLLAALFSCQSKIRRLPEPADLIPRDSMVNVLQDMMVLESHIQSRYPQVNQFYKAMRRSGDTLLARHNISFERYDRSLDYYGSRQEEMESIYTEVMDSLNRRMTELEAKRQINGRH